MKQTITHSSFNKLLLAGFFTDNNCVSNGELIIALDLLFLRNKHVNRMSQCATLYTDNIDFAVIGPQNLSQLEC